MPDDMSTNEDHGKYDIEEFRKIAHVVDFVIHLINLFNQHLTRLCDSLRSLPHKFTTVGAANIISEAMDSIRASEGLITKIMPSNESRGKSYQEFWHLHSALIFYHYEALMLLRYSLLSAFSGYYSVAFTELRSAMESLIRGIVFDLLSIPKYRRNAEELKKIKGFEKAPSFHELLDVLEKELSDERPKTSVEIFDMIDRKLKGFNPRAAFIKLLTQLKDWHIIDDELFQDINSYYTELSKRVHRVHPEFSDVGVRILADKDWLELEPVPDELSAYLRFVVYLNGLFTYLVLEIFSIDLVHDKFRRCIKWSDLDESVQLAEKLAENYKPWKYTVEILEQLKT